MFGLVSVNLVAVVVSAVATIVLGMLWYGPLFGKQWMSMMGMKEPSKEEKSKMMNKMLPSMAGGFVASLVTAFVLAQFMTMVQAKDPMTGVMVGALVWLGFLATTTLNTVLWEGKPVKLYLLNNGHLLVNSAVIGAIIGAMA